MKRKSNSEVKADKARLSKLLFRQSSFIDNLTVKTENESESANKKPAWVDEDDVVFTANSIMDTKCKELYAATLKQKYENLMGTPKWAQLGRTIKQEDDCDDDILHTVGHLQRRKKTSLKEGLIELKRFPKINSETGNEGPIIKSVEFHPTSSVALVGGQSGVVSLFTIGGDKNKKLHSVAIQNFPVMNAHFMPDGSNALLSSHKSHCYAIYNLMEAKVTLVQLPKVMNRPKAFELSPCGKYLATADGFDEIHIVCTTSRELLRTLKQSSVVEAIVFSSDSKTLYSLGAEGSVTVWNMATFRVVNKFIDEGCVTGSAIATSPCGRLLATGSGEGIINVYDCTSVDTPQPKPAHTVQNLRTKISSIKFNATSEILGISSSIYPNAIKLVHIPSYHVFCNFPDTMVNFHQVASFNFSPNSGFFAVSNNKNCAFLYRLKHYKNY